MTVDWDAVAGAKSYNVYRGANKTFDKSVAQPQYITNGLTPDTKLTINVSAVNESGESAMTEIATKTQV
ncbi:fibronectin type III domain-containing protein [Bacillus atrophaeus]|nr:fibronectin type III domain-containing protein [Bacillus atrophaeus]MCY8969617.1 fibronectin type III domain-containing protein [Bacillus atrophaeus]